MPYTFIKSKVSCMWVALYFRNKGAAAFIDLTEPPGEEI